MNSWVCFLIGFGVGWCVAGLPTLIIVRRVTGDEGIVPPVLLVVLFPLLWPVDVLMLMARAGGRMACVRAHARLLFRNMAGLDRSPGEMVDDVEEVTHLTRPELFTMCSEEIAKSAAAGLRTLGARNENQRSRKEIWN